MPTYSAPSTTVSLVSDTLDLLLKRGSVLTGPFFKLAGSYLQGIERKEVRIVFFSIKERGQGLVEYALILILVAIVVIAVLMLLGPIVANVFSTLNNSLSSLT